MRRITCSTGVCEVLDPGRDVPVWLIVAQV
jgi:hypothetical protein